MDNYVSYSMEEFINMYHNGGMVTYQPQDLERGERILVFADGRWKSALFIDYSMCEMPHDRIYAVLDNNLKTDTYQTWVVVEG